jgi:hypothetical protein
MDDEQDETSGEWQKKSKTGGEESRLEHAQESPAEDIPMQVLR